jgi:hypothetical protein
MTNNFKYENQSAQEAFGVSESRSIIGAILLAPITVPMAILGAILDFIFMTGPDMLFVSKEDRYPINPNIEKTKTEKLCNNSEIS